MVEGRQPARPRPRPHLPELPQVSGRLEGLPVQGEVRLREGRGLEVVTILPRPATIRLPGRKIEYEAPAGFFRKQFPMTPGPVGAELVRDGKVVVRLESPEPITDKPFREDHGLVCFSTEFMQHWKEDFGDTKPLLYSEYADAGRTGCPTGSRCTGTGNSWISRRGTAQSPVLAPPTARPTWNRCNAQSSIPPLAGDRCPAARNCLVTKNNDNCPARPAYRG